MSPKTGRPKIDNPKTSRLEIRVTPDEKAEIQGFSEENGYSLLSLLKMGIDSVKQSNRLTHARAFVIIHARAKGRCKMSAKMGRPTANKKTERLEIRLTPQEAQDLQYCADALGISRTDVINKGVQLVKEEVAKKQ